MTILDKWPELEKKEASLKAKAKSINSVLKQAKFGPSFTYGHIAGPPGGVRRILCSGRCLCPNHKKLHPYWHEMWAPNSSGSSVSSRNFAAIGLPLLKAANCEVFFVNAQPAG